MTKYREIIRLTGLGFSQRNIMASCDVAQKTVVKVQKRARELDLSWPLDESMTDAELQRLMFSKESTISKNKRMPDYDYIRKELLRNGVSKKTLWTEYMEDCRANGDEPLMYSQFCYHIQQDEQKRRATVVVKHFCNTLFENSPGISSFKWCFPIIVGMRTDMIVPYVHISV